MGLTGLERVRFCLCGVQCNGILYDDHPVLKTLAVLKIVLHGIMFLPTSTAFHSTPSRWTQNGFDLHGAASSIIREYICT